MPQALGPGSAEMKRHVAALVALVTSLAVFDSHVDWETLDDRGLLAVNGQRFDLRGWASELALAWQRDCRALPLLPQDSPTAQAVLSVIQKHSPPDSLSARALQLRHLDNWSLAEVTFDKLKPTLVVLRLQDGQWRVQDQAVWSGATAPWHSGDFVRRYLRRQAPDLPQALLACTDIDPSRYGQVPGGLGPVTTPGPVQP